MVDSDRFMMEMPVDAKIIVIEGVAGAGKNTLLSNLESLFSSQGRSLFSFQEEELVLGWKHAWIPGINEIRLAYCLRFLEYVSQKVSSDPTLTFVCNRFHISLLTLGSVDLEDTDEYQKILSILTKLRAQILIPILTEDVIEQRAQHSERKDYGWKEHLAKRMETRGSSSLKEMYLKEQELIVTIANRQGLPFSILSVSP